MRAKKPRPASRPATFIEAVLEALRIEKSGSSRDIQVVLTIPRKVVNEALREAYGAAVPKGFAKEVKNVIQDAVASQLGEALGIHPPEGWVNRPLPPPVRKKLEAYLRRALRGLLPAKIGGDRRSVPIPAEKMEEFCLRANQLRPLWLRIRTRARTDKSDWPQQVTGFGEFQELDLSSRQIATALFKTMRVGTRLRGATELAADHAMQELRLGVYTRHTGGRARFAAAATLIKKCKRTHKLSARKIEQD